MKTVVTMNAQGRITVPSAARELLRVEGPTEFEVEVSENEMILRPALVVPREDAWAYTTEHMRRIAAAQADVLAGRTRSMTPDELAKLTGATDS